MTVTAEGFDRPRLPEIKADYDQRFTDALGPVNTAPDAVVGQIIGIFSEALDNAYEALQDTYDSMYPPTAEGTSLDGAVSLVGLTRLGATPTVVIGVTYGAESTLIPAGAIARSIDNRQYATTADAVISRSAAVDVQITVSTVINAATYQVIAGGVSVVYTSDASATGAEIATGLAALFDPLVFTATASGNVVSLRSLDGVTDFALTVDSKLSITRLGTPVVFTSIELGAYALPANSLTSIDSSVLGWDEVNNLAAGDIGRFVETDEALRIRHADSVRATGSATVKAIRARLVAEVDAIEYAAIYENRSGEPDAFGLPSHSFEAVVSGGTNQAVANKLFELKPAGIETYGTISVPVVDENGDGQTMRFSRPADVYAWIRVSVNTLYPEEQLTTAVVGAIKDAVLAYGQTLSVGDDLLLQRFYGPIYTATSGIGSITVEGSMTAGPVDTPLYTTANIAVGRTGLAVFDAVRISVVGV